MSFLSGYDSEAIGFDSVTQKARSESDCSTQTNFTASGVSTQTTFSKDCGTSSEKLIASDDILREYPPPGLNAFLRKVVPTMMEQLDQTDKELLYNSSDTDEEESIAAKLFQEIQGISDAPLSGAGDYQSAAVLSTSWSSSGNSLAVSIGRTKHENWCDHDGLIRIYTLKRAAGDKLVHSLDITEKNCVTVVKYHPAVAALLAYGTASGEVVLCNLRNSDIGNVDGMQLTSPSGCHGSRRVTALQWADAPLSNVFSMMQINNTGKRRGASDQVLMSSGSDGTINVWQVNSNQRIFENVICYSINGSKSMAVPDITCFDFLKNYPLRPSDEKMNDYFVVGSKCGKVYLCNCKVYQQVDGNKVDPICEVFDGHATCILDVAFSFQKPGIFVSMSIDSELRVYDVNQMSPLKIICLNNTITCMGWLPNTPCVVLGLASEGKVLQVFNVSSGKPVSVDGLSGHGTVTAMAVTHTGTCRIAAGDSASTIRIFDLPSRRIRLSPEDLDF